MPQSTPPPLADVWAWQERAACRDVNPNLFFAPEEERGMRRRARELVAIALCGTCPVRTECRLQADAFGDTYGVWGGTTEHQREVLAQPSGKQPTGKQSTGRQPTGRQPTGTQPTGTQSTGKQSTGSSKPAGKRRTLQPAGSAR